MTICSRLSDYLERHGAQFDICAHPRSRTSVQTARVAHVQPQQLAKSVIVEDDAGCVMAVVPGDRKVQLGRLARLLERKHLHLTDEDRIAELFTDCDRGAVPALGMAWGVETIVDDELEASEFVYLEGGDHECLLRLSHEQFHELMREARHGHFSAVPVH
ncbi:MAG: YbaK/EbsC family protein [Burkholderiaceae bacterium]